MQSTEGNAYMVSEGGVLDGVLSSQGNAAEQNEEEDQVGEDRVVDDAVALEAKSAWGGGAKEKLVSKAREAARAPDPTSSSHVQKCSRVWGVGFSACNLTAAG